MSYSNPALQAYRNNSIQTASQERLLIMLYDGCLSALQIAKNAMESGNVAETNKQLIKAQNILLEFQNTLNMEYEISNNLAQLYDFFYRKLVEANVQKNPAIIDEITPMIKGLRDSFFEASIQVMQEREAAQKAQKIAD